MMLCMLSNAATHGAPHTPLSSLSRGEEGLRVPLPLGEGMKGRVIFVALRLVLGACVLKTGKWRIWQLLAEANSRVTNLLPLRR